MHTQIGIKLAKIDDIFNIMLKNIYWVSENRKCCITLLLGTYFSDNIVSEKKTK